MSAEEFHSWVRYYNTEPFGQPRTEAIHGDMMSSMWALHGSSQSPPKLRKSSEWQFQPKGGQNIDAEEEAAMVLAKIGG